MLLPIKPFFTYKFGSMGATIDSARQTPFFAWFHLEETERRSEEPGEVVRFRPSGNEFRQLCYLDILTTTDGNLVQMELVVQRSFIDGRNSLFAQDLVKSFLLAVLPDACQSLLGDFIDEIETLGRGGSTVGFEVFQGRKESWEKKTGWTQLRLTNLLVSGTPSLVVRTAANPDAPNAILLKGDESMTQDQAAKNKKVAFFSSMIGLGCLAVCLVIAMNPTLLAKALFDAQKNYGIVLGSLLLFGTLIKEVAGNTSAPIWVRVIVCFSLFVAGVAFFVVASYMGGWLLLLIAVVLFVAWLKAGRPKLPSWKEINGR